MLYKVVLTQSISEHSDEHCLPVLLTNSMLLNEVLCIPEVVDYSRMQMNASEKLISSW